MDDKAFTPILLVKIEREIESKKRNRIFAEILETYFVSRLWEFIFLGARSKPHFQFSVISSNIVFQFFIEIIKDISVQQMHFIHLFLTNFSCSLKR